MILADDDNVDDVWSDKSCPSAHASDDDYSKGDTGSDEYDDEDDDLVDSDDDYTSKRHSKSSRGSRLKLKSGSNKNCSIVSTGKPPLAPSRKLSPTAAPSVSKTSLRMVVPAVTPASSKCTSAASSACSTPATYLAGIPYLNVGTPSADDGTPVTVGNHREIMLPEGVVGLGSHEHNQWPWLRERRDANKRRVSDPDFDPRTLVR